MSFKVNSRKCMTVLIFLFVVLLIMVSVGCAGPAPTPTMVKQSVKVGLILTYTGAISPAGFGACSGFMDHLKWINMEGGIEYTDPVTRKTERATMDLIWEDSQYDAARSVAIYKRLKAARVKLISEFGSTPGEAIAASLSADRIPCYNFYGCGSPAGYKPEPRYYLVSLPTPSEEDVFASSYFIKQWKGDRPPRIACLALAIPSWRPLDEGAPKEPVSKLGGVYVGNEWFVPTATDLTVQLQRLINDWKADCIILHPQASHTATALRNLRSMGKEIGVGPGKITVMVVQCGHDERLATLPGELVDGVLCELVAALSSETNLPGVKLAVEKVGPAMGRSPKDLTQLYMTGFGQAYVVEAWLKQTLEKTGLGGLNSEALRDTLFNLKDIDCGGVLYPVTVRAPDYPSTTYWEKWAKLIAGKGYTEISDWMRVPDLTGGRW